MIRNLVTLLIGSALWASSALIYAGTPQIKCDISMATWCITTFDGTINMEDKGNVRVWTLQARSASPLPMKIVEPKACSDDAKEVLLQGAAHEDIGGDHYEKLSFVLNENGCRLDFSLPKGETNQMYKRFMLYGILVGYEKSHQLYEISTFDD